MTKIKPDHDPDSRPRQRSRRRRASARYLPPRRRKARSPPWRRSAAALNAVDTASVAGRSDMPMLQFKSREGGIWMFGQQRTVA